MFVFLNEWRSAVSKFGALTREFYIKKSGHGKIMVVSEFGGLWGGGVGGGRYNNMVYFNLHLTNRADHGENCGEVVSNQRSYYAKKI